MARQGSGERTMVPAAAFDADDSYYGKPILNGPVWKTPHVPGYLFLGGLAGGSSLLGAGAELTGRHAMAVRSKTAAVVAAAASGGALVADLGRPGRFINMLRTFKPSSPMSVGSWVLAVYGPAAGAAALSAITGRATRAGTAATAATAVLGPVVAGYTAALLADTAVPAWHDAYRELPFVFVGSAAMAAGGFGLAAAPPGDASPARRLAAIGWAGEVVSSERMTRRLGLVAESYKTGAGSKWMKAGKALSLGGVVGSYAAGRTRAGRVMAGLALMGGSLCTRFGVFFAGLDSAADPRQTVAPQRERMRSDGERPVRSARPASP